MAAADGAPCCLRPAVRDRSARPDSRTQWTVATDDPSTAWVGKELPEGTAESLETEIFHRRTDELRESGDPAWSLLRLVPHHQGPAEVPCAGGESRRLLLLTDARSGLSEPRTLAVRVGERRRPAAQPHSSPQQLYNVEHCPVRGAGADLPLGVAVTRWFRRDGGARCGGERSWAVLQAAAAAAAMLAQRAHAVPSCAVFRWPGATFVLVYDADPGRSPGCKAALVGTTGCTLSASSGCAAYDRFCDATARLAFDLCSLLSHRHSPAGGLWASLSVEVRRGEEMVGRCGLPAPVLRARGKAAAPVSVGLRDPDSAPLGASITLQASALDPAEGLAQHVRVEVGAATGLPESRVPWVVVVRAEGLAGGAAVWERSAPSRSADWSGEAFDFTAAEAPAIAASCAGVGRPVPQRLPEFPGPGAPPGAADGPVRDFGRCIGVRPRSRLPDRPLSPASPAASRQPQAADDFRGASSSSPPASFIVSFGLCAVAATGCVVAGVVVLAEKGGLWGGSATFAVALVLIIAPTCGALCCFLRGRRRYRRRQLREQHEALYEMRHARDPTRDPASDAGVFAAASFRSDAQQLSAEPLPPPGDLDFACVAPALSGSMSGHGRRPTLPVIPDLAPVLRRDLSTP
eukprot:TRINITY_DN4456_c0_g3_i1.p1 TRINITY_DN4456_c0_g3~~TRINITY_DN4456_c0_g3_i1.p1  ORF type:complete len:632 (+),score=181.74 TRINITY_DN4456_c0_g3_i1:154-2049(+)